MALKRDRWPLYAAYLALMVDFIGFYQGDRMPIIAIVASFPAVLFSVGAIAGGIRPKMWLAIGLGVLALLGTLPVIFVADAGYVCATQHSCM
jgi:hypothetical protein